MGYNENEYVWLYFMSRDHWIVNLGAGHIPLVVEKGPNIALIHSGFPEAAYVRE